MRGPISKNVSAGRPSRLAAMGCLVAALAAGLATTFAPAPAAAETGAETEEETLALKADWQGRYRALRNNAVRMRENATKLRRAYGLAQHANYPRGGAREEFKKEVEQAERDADRYEAELVEFHEEARRNEIPPGWLLEVDDEPIDRGLPAAQEDSEDAPDRGGRNPLYDDDEADDETGDGDPGYGDDEEEEDDRAWDEDEEEDD